MGWSGRALDRLGCITLMAGREEVVGFYVEEMEEVLKYCKLNVDYPHYFLKGKL